MTADPSLDEQVAALTHLLETRPPDVDPAVVAGALGGALLELYWRDHDPDTLDRALAHLHDAVAAAPEHPEHLLWYERLGLGYGERAERTQEVVDYDHGIGWVWLVRDGLPPGDGDRESVAVLLMDLLWDRYRSLRFGPDSDDARADREVRLLCAQLDALRPAEGHPDAPYAWTLLGLANLDWFDVSRARHGLDRGVEALASGWPELPPDAPRHLYAGAELANAYRMRAELDGDAESLDRAIEAGERTIGAHSAEERWWVLLHQYHALACQLRWERTERPADLTRGIDCWRVVLADGPEPWAATRCGEMLRQRASLADDAADAREAIDVLGYAAEATVGDPDIWQPWYQLALALEVRWSLDRDRVCLDEAARCVDQVLELGTAEGDDLLRVHLTRITIARAALEHDGERPYTGIPPSAHRMRRCLDEAGEAVDGAVGGPGDVRGMLAGMVAMGELYVGAFLLHDADLDRLAELAALGAQVPDASGEWSAVMDLTQGMVQFTKDAVRDGGTRDWGITHLIRAARSEPAGTVAAIARQVLSMALNAKAMEGADVRGIRSSERMLRDAAADRPSAAADAELFSALFTMGDHGLFGDIDEVGRLGLRLDDALANGSGSTVDHRPSTLIRDVMSRMAAIVRGEPDQPRDEAPPAESGSFYAVMRDVLGAIPQIMTAIVEDDVPLLRRCADDLRERIDGLPEDHRFQLPGNTMLGRAELEIAKRTRDRSAAGRGADRLRVARERARGPHHPLWTQLALGEAEALRLAGDPDRPRTRRLAMSALHGHAWRALRQSGTDYAIDAARAAVSDALTIAGWCRADGAFDDLVAALDAGRGLVLHSATASREVVDQLVESGHPDLAAEWEASGGLGRDRLTGAILDPATAGLEVSDDLRGRVLRALGAGGVPALGPLAPLDVDEIRAALRAVDRDALVYLVGGDGARTGMAVIVPAGGPVEVVDLPDLRVDEGSALARYAAGPRSRRDAEPTGAPGPRVGDLCDWAWSAAMGELVGRVGRRPGPGPGRLVLVPMGALALVPWHAARDGAGRYAVHDVVCSYTVSARMFIATARRPAVPSRAALVVGDPRGDLPFAGIEARAIHRRFYRDGSYFGRPVTGADAAGTPDEVLAWIAAAASGPSTLHFACHGWADPRHPADAHLLLAGGTLPARTLLEASRLAALELGRVFLAACTTGVTGADHDEAFSLAAAFLAAGAHTVFGSLWPVPDADTSLLMYLVHHYLNAESSEPAEALHRAQLWMLDPDRRPPHGMPAELVDCCGRPEAADPVAWAAFTHLGR